MNFNKRQALIRKANGLRHSGNPDVAALASAVPELCSQIDGLLDQRRELRVEVFKIHGTASPVVSAIPPKALREVRNLAGRS